MCVARAFTGPALFLALLPSVAEAREQQRPIDHFMASPVYYERFSPAHLYIENLQTLPLGQLVLPTFGVETVEDFDWRSHSRGDQSWWIQVERMDYVLPFIESTDSSHHAFARLWIGGWLDTHETDPTPNVGSYDEMGIGIRALVLVRYMKHLKLSEPHEVVLQNRIRRMLRWHLRYLQDPGNFNRNSNHGFWEALGLMEITRVIPDSAATILGQRRLLSVVGASVSPSGVHVERAAGYHFVFYDWVSNATAYVQGLRRSPARAGAVLSQHASRMRAASYFYYDHALRVPQIGDTDAMMVPEHGLTAAGEPGEVLFDEVAGLAFFKDADGRPHQRYIVFGICNARNPLTMPFHSHNDALSVYYSDEGEVILGDQGRFTYEHVPERDHYRSSAAHNTWVGESSLFAHKQPETELAREVWQRAGDDSVLFGGYLKRRGARREVTVARGGAGGLSVRDELSPGEAGFLLWHLGPDVVRVDRVSAGNGSGRQGLAWRLYTAGGNVHEMLVELTGAATLDVEEIRGDKARYLGWYSPGYRQAEPCRLLCIKVGAGAARVVRTTIRPANAPD
jgi:hypothetical protein